MFVAADVFVFRGHSQIVAKRMITARSFPFACSLRDAVVIPLCIAMFCDLFCTHGLGWQHSLCTLLVVDMLYTTDDHR